MSKSAINWNFSPHPLIPGGHMQSVLGIHWPTKVAPYVATRHPIPLEDGDQLMLHEDAPPQAGDGTPSVLMIHGLGGCHMSTYMCRMVEKLTERGYRVFRLDQRGCGAGQGVAKKPTHCGRWTDVAAALYAIAELYPETVTSIVGYSMGGTLTMNMLAESGDMRVGNLDRSFVVCPPIDLSHVEQHFRTFWGRQYDRFFVKLIWEQVVSRWDHFPETAPAELPRRKPKKLRDIDELVIAPSGGFDSAEHYYAEASPGPKLAAIKQPLTIVFSEDDPVVPVEPLLNTPHNSSIEVITTRHGGHLGFLSGRSRDPETRDPDFRWLDWRIIDWLALGQKTEGGRRKDESHRAESPRMHSVTKHQPAH